jgi:ribosomal protein L37AE/L43A
MLRKFQILYERARRFIITRLSQRSQRKKFDVMNLTQHTSVTQATETRSTSRLRNMTQTRPKKCGRCQTSENSRPGNITKLDNGLWKCKACGHTWRG